MTELMTNIMTMTSEISLKHFKEILSETTCNLEEDIVLKPLDPFGTRKRKKVHRFTNNLRGLQKVVVKDFS